MKPSNILSFAAIAAALCLTGCDTIEERDHDHDRDHRHHSTTTRTTTRNVTYEHPFGTTVETETTRQY